VKIESVMQIPQNAIKELIIRFKMVFMVLLAAAIFTPDTAFSYEKIYCYNLQPPEIIMRDVRRIAILDFALQDSYYTWQLNRNRGQIASDRLVNLLLSDNVGIRDVKKKGFGIGTIAGRTYQKWATTKIFSIIERSQLEQIIKEQDLGMNNLIDASKAAELGKLMGVDAIITGTIRFDKNENYISKKRKKKKINGVKKVTSVTASLRIISTETGEILGSKEVFSEASDEHYYDDRGTIASTESLLEICLTESMEKLVNYFCPIFVYFQGNLDKLSDKKFRKQGDSAAKMAEGGNLDGAYSIYQAVYQEDPYDPKLLFNLGLLNETVGNYSEAKEFYQNALSLKSKAKKYRKANERMQNIEGLLEDFRDIGLPVEPHEWNTTQDALQQESTQKVVVKGKNSQRHEIKELADNNSTVVAKVPGGVEFTVLDRDGDWFKIQLLGGKEGFIHNSQISDIK
jgi:curli biogenesis system outer membrane secretion channel CsgG